MENIIICTCLYLYRHGNIHVILATHFLLYLVYSGFTEINAVSCSFYECNLTAQVYQGFSQSKIKAGVDFHYRPLGLLYNNAVKKYSHTLYS